MIATYNAGLKILGYNKLDEKLMVMIENKIYIYECGQYYYKYLENSVTNKWFSSAIRLLSSLRELEVKSF